LTDGTDLGSANSSAAHWQVRVAAARQGNREAQGEILQRLGAFLRARAERRLDGMLQVKVSPSDIVQETLLEAHRSFAHFKGDDRGELVLWLSSILNHRVHNAYRKYRGTDKRDLSREKPLQLIDDSAQQLVLGMNNISTPSGQAVANEESARLEQALRELSLRQEQVIRLRNELKLSFTEIALALSCSSDAAQKLWSRAVKQLARNVKHHAANQKQQ
jgi:RNA polymerase sigma-70 factor, ECF subfamily